MTKLNHILFFNEISLDSIDEVGGKNASLGEMYNQLKPMGIAIPNGFALTANAYRMFRTENHLEKKLTDLLGKLDTEEYSNLSDIGKKIRSLVLSATIPKEICEEIIIAYKVLS